MSFMNNMKRTGLKTDPLGTPGLKKISVNDYLRGPLWEKVLDPGCCDPLNAKPVQIVHEPAVGDFIEGLA